MKYVSGALQKGSLTLDDNMVNKVLKRKEKEAEKKQKKKTGKLPLLNRARMIADRTKAASILSDKWSKMEDLRIRIIVRMKTLKAYHDHLKELKREHETMSEQFKILRYERVRPIFEWRDLTLQNVSADNLLHSIRELQEKLSFIKSLYLENKQKPKNELIDLTKLWKKNLRETERNVTHLKKELGRCNDELKKLEPFQVTIFFQIRLYLIWVGCHVFRFFPSKTSRTRAAKTR